MKTPTYEQALTVYLEAVTSGRTLKDVVEEAGFPIGSVSAKVSLMKKKGVRVPGIRRGGAATALNVTKLNRLVKELVG